MWGFDPLSGLFHAGVGILFGYAGFFQRDTTTIRQMVGGLGVLVIVVKALMVLALLAGYRHFEHGPIEISCLVAGITSILAARYLPGDRPRSER